MKKSSSILVVVFCFLTLGIMGQNVSINNTGAAPHASAMLDVSDTASGILIPRLTQAQMLNISFPPVGLLIFQTDNMGFYYYDGDYWNPVSSTINPPFTTTDSIIHTDFLNNYSFILGADSLNHLGGPNARLAFYNHLKAFRSGYVNTNEWHQDSVGEYSFAHGYDVKATGNHSVVFGDSTVSTGVGNLVSGANSTVSGWYNEVSGIFHDIAGNRSVVGGQYNTISGSHSHAVFGSNNDILASNPGSFVGGLSNTVSFGQATTIFGQLNETSHHYAFAAGVLDTVGGYCSTTFGRENVVNGAYSIAVGLNNTINSNSSTSTLFGTNNTSYSSNNFASGISNVVDSNGAVVFGSSNTVQCYECFGAGINNLVRDTFTNAGKNFAIGDGNQVNGFASGAFGSYNNIIAYNGIALGENHTISANSSVAGGGYNTITGEFSTAFGYANTVNNNYAFAGGNANTINGWGSVAFGFSNTINDAGTAFASGYNNTLSDGAASSAAFGVNNTLNNFHSFTVGSYNTANAEESMAIGHNVISYSKAEVVVGMFNAAYSANSLTAHNTNDRIFVIGNGTSDASRSNAVTVLKSGYVGVGTTSPTHILHIAGIGRSSSSTWATSSDKRAKTNIKTIENASETLMKFNPVTFNWNEAYKSNHNVTSATNYGFISQEVEQIVPEMVSSITESIGSTQINDFKLLDKDPLLALLVKAFQEQQLEIEQLKNEINALKALVPATNQTAEK